MENTSMRASASPGPYFKPLLSRNTSIIVLRFRKKEETFLLLSLATRSDTQVVRMDATDGRLHYEGKKGQDLFDTEGDALDHLSDIDSFEILERGCALLGYAPIGNVGMLLLATRLRSAAVLPGGHQIRLVAESKWLQIPFLEYKGQHLNPTEVERVENMQNYTLNNAHFFCETADITRAFPSSRLVSEPSWEFVWNRWMAAALRETGLPDCCPHLLQGVVESRVLEDQNFQKYMLVLLSRRSRLHPGMRYIARGLNSLASPGNEIECEQIFFTCPGGSEALQWSSYIWRRGTVPIWWGVELRQGGVGEATINVNARNPYRGTRRYFRRLQRRYYADLGIPSAAQQDGDAVNGSSPTGSSRGGGESEAGSSADPSIHVPVTCINLLRCSMQRKDELLLSEHFAEGVRTVRKKVPGAPLRVLNFDWHGTIKELKEPATVEGLWALLESVVPQTDMSVGTLEPRRDAEGASPSGREPVTAWDDTWQARWRSQQCGVVRYNCADSLDRTNAASYFAAVQVMAEQSRRLGILVENEAPRRRISPNAVTRRKQRDRGGALEISSIHRRVRGLIKARGVESAGLRAPSPPPVPQLPAGWEERKDPASGRSFFIDHNNKVTTWERPSSGNPDDRLLPEGHIQGVSDSDGGTELRSFDPQSVEHSDGSESESLAAERECPWGLFGLSVEEMRDRLRADLVAAHAENFLINGDMNANLYTSSRAMHSSILGLLQGESGAVSKAGVGRLANLGVTLQRRWANVLSDATRQVVVECFLGLRLKEHFPTQSLLYGGEVGVPLEGESDEDERDADEIFATATRDKESLPPDLVNQVTLVGLDEKKEGGDSVPASAELQPSEADPGSFLSPAVETAGFATSPPAGDPQHHPLR